MIITGNEAEAKGLRTVAELMCLAARTAPKGRGVDNLHTGIVEGEAKQRVADEMRRIGEEGDIAFFVRDADNVENCPLVVVVGTQLKPLGIPHCGFCGAKNCAENVDRGGVCAFNTGDLGVAIGSAVSVAALHHADNRVLFTFGRSAINVGILPGEVKIAYGIPLSATGKNPFFDRK